MPNKYKAGTVRIYIRMHESLKKRLFEAARRLGISANEFVRRAIENAISELEKQSGTNKQE